MKETLLKLLVYGTVLLLLFFGIMHLVAPLSFILFFPQIMPLKLREVFIYFLGIFEIMLGYGFLFPGSRCYLSHFIIRLLLTLLVMHIWELFIDRQVNTPAVLERIFIQVIFIGVLWWIKKQTALNNRRFRQYYKGRRIFSRN
jgi:uncharacterized membrane protein